mmetsp:Transcript_13330/g.22649  ORF Transcript_13330/g.22649 Transcript_13330/m.22649 type:complete len:197 (+) Transcript_13330:590-1180(+)|eukprot:CAMPEP_0168626026 /NCGR_PEP_ID=MMETSP0449_2-20121227/10385_1 /TAXON_ID=1082188 /ORGANISM="Strombidium rassoulzadegani, Strain ras09" /LENGTH=196 /DNA_ID=CAMNT_0008667939 /DNA_START=540 /DNA_END=1130 /DNA_ORIENTATION=-
MQLTPLPSQPVQDQELQPSSGKVLPAWIPTVLGILAPIMFAIQGMTIKHFTSERIGFDSNVLTFSSCFSVCFIALIIGALWFWPKVQAFDPYLFLIGLGSSILDTLATVSLQMAYTKGPAGPVSAVSSLNAVFLSILQSFIQRKFPRSLEIIGFVIGLIGATIMVLPDQVLHILSILFRRRPTPESKHKNGESSSQ